MKKQEEIIGENLLAKEEVSQTQNSTGENPKPVLRQLTLGKKLPTSALARTLGIGKNKKVWVASGAIVLILILFVILPLFGVVRAVGKLSSTVKQVQDGFRAQDLGLIKQGLTQLDGDLTGFERSLTPLVWVRVLPWVGFYWSDSKAATVAAREGIEAAQILIPAVEPYADILGFGGAAPPAGEADGAKTAEERIDFIIASLPSVLPKIDEVKGKLITARDAITTIDASRYPTTFRGKQIRSTVLTLQTFIADSATLLVDGKPLLERLPYLLGMDAERTYLVIFQNDKELRPTGGFMTGYSLMKVKSGKIQPVTSDDIYNLDKRYRAHITAPKPFLEHIKQPYGANPNWRLRDMNWSPDFKMAISSFLEEAKTAGLKEVDGVIAVDTNILVSLLEVTGRIGVPEQGNFSAEKDPRCDCPLVIYELESYADVEKPIVWDPNTGKIVYGEIVDNRKAILGPLVNSVIANSLAQPKEKVPVLAQVVLSNLMDKHVLLYMFDEDTQKAIETFNVGGRVKDTEGDYLQIVDANIGGRKANLYVQQEVVDKVVKKGDKVVHELEITYKNPQKHDGWLNSVLPNSIRVYVPKGTKLISSSGAGDMETSEELGKTVFNGFFELRPEGVVKVMLEYEVSKVGEPYTYLIQQQPGKPASRYTITVGKDSEEFELKNDRHLRFH